MEVPKELQEDGDEPSETLGEEALFSPKEIEDDTAEEEEDEADEDDDKEDAKRGRSGWLPSWLPQSFEVASDVKVRRPRSLPPRKVTMTTRQRKMGEKLKALAADDEKKGEVLTFSPGPSQVVSTQMKKMIDEEIRQRVDEELKKLGKTPKIMSQPHARRPFQENSLLLQKKEMKEKMMQKMMNNTIQEKDAKDL